MKMRQLRDFYVRVRESFNRPTLSILRDYQPPDAASQLSLSMIYRQQVATGIALPAISDTGFKVFSQTDEDGILLFIFSVIGSTNKQCVEICAGDGIECNAANLIVNHGWNGLLFDGNAELVQRGTAHYRNHKATFVYPPKLVCAWIQKSNVNELIRQNEVEGEIDLLSIDLDGMDYWIWDAIEVITPRVIVVEYQDIIGPDRALTVPYADDFDARKYPTTDGLPNFCGASLQAFIKLGRRKGYRFVGCNRSGYNAFFIKTGLADRLIPEQPAAGCFRHPKVVWGMKHRWPSVANLPWVEV